MKSTLDAAESLLGTVEAARAHLLLIANQNLSVEDALSFGAEARVGASPERALLHVATISLDLARVAVGLPSGPGVVAAAESADEPITRPDSPLPAEAEELSSLEEAEPTEVIDTAEPVGRALPPTAQDPASAAPPTQVEATDREPSAAAPPGLRVDDLVRGALPDPLLPPWARAKARPVASPDAKEAPVRGGAGPAPEVSSQDPTDLPPDAPALAGSIGASLMAAMGQPRARAPSLGPSLATSTAAPPQPAASPSWAPPTRPQPVQAPPELVERGGLEEPAAVAAVQILGVGSARTLSPTLALDGAPGLAAPAVSGGPMGPAGDLAVDFEEPEDETGSEDEGLELTASPAEDPASGIIVTRDGVQHRDGAKVADADVAASQLDGLLLDAEASEQRGNLREAVLHYSDLLSLKPSHAAAHLGRGRCFVELGDYGSAMSDFHRAEDLEPGRPEPLLEMGNLFYARKEYTKGISYYDQALEVSPDFARAWVRRGLCHQYLRDHQQALSDLQRAAALDPDIPNLRMYIDMARKGLGRSGR